MKNLEHTIRDVLSGKQEQNLIEEINNHFVQSVKEVYGSELSEEQFLSLYENYVNHLIEQEPSMMSRMWSGAKHYGGGIFGAGSDAYSRYQQGQPWYHIAGGSLASGIGGQMGGQTLGRLGPLAGAAGSYLGSYLGSSAYDKAFGIKSSNDSTDSTLAGGAAGYLAGVGRGLGRVGRLGTTIAGGLAGRTLDQISKGPEPQKPPFDPAGEAAKKAEQDKKPAAAPTPPPTPPPKPPRVGDNDMGLGAYPPALQAARERENRAAPPPPPPTPPPAAPAPVPPSAAPAPGASPSAPTPPQVRTPTKPPEETRKQKPVTSAADDDWKIATGRSGQSPTMSSVFGFGKGG